MQVMNTNVAGVAVMTQKLLPLLLKGKDGKTVKRVMNIGSTLGSIEMANHINSTSYRCSKIAVNMLTKTFALEFPDVIFISMHPGWVQTDMGSAQDRSPPVTIESSCSGMVNVLEQKTQEESGSFWGFDGKKLPY